MSEREELACLIVSPPLIAPADAYERALQQADAIIAAGWKKSVGDE